VLAAWIKCLPNTPHQVEPCPKCSEATNPSRHNARFCPPQTASLIRRAKCDCPGPVGGEFDIGLLAHLRSYAESYAWVFPDKRLHRRFAEMFKGLIAVGVPIVAQIAAAVIQSDDPQRTFHVVHPLADWAEPADRSAVLVSSRKVRCIRILSITLWI